MGLLVDGQCITWVDRTRRRLTDYERTESRREHVLKYSNPVSFTDSRTGLEDVASEIARRESCKVGRRGPNEGDSISQLAPIAALVSVQFAALR